MKKQNMIKFAAAAALTLGLSGNALAAIDNGDLIRVVYDTVGSVEYATDLGSFQDILTRTAAGEKNIVAGAGVDAIQTSIFSAATQMADLRVAYFTFDSANGKWVGLASGLESINNISRKYSTFQSASQALTYGATGTTGAYDLHMVTADSAKLENKSAPSTFFTKFSAALPGSVYAGMVANNTDGIASLAALATGDQVDQNFFTWTGTKTDNASAGTLAFTLTTLADGSTVINKMDEAPVPVPAAAWLLASGLAGLVGVRRRMNKEA
jgi:hypothetical protein